KAPEQQVNSRRTPMLICKMLNSVLATSFVITQLILFKPVVAVAQSSARSFGQFNFYDATALVDQTAPLFIQVGLNEVYPPPPSSNQCQSIQIQPGNGCNVDTDTTRTPQTIVSEVSRPSKNLLVKKDGMEALLHFDQQSGSFKLTADTPAAQSGEFRSAASTLNFEYEFTLGPASKFFKVSEIELSTVSGVSGAGIDLHLSLRNSIGAIWSQSDALRFNDS